MKFRLGDTDDTQKLPILTGDTQRLPPLSESELITLKVEQSFANTNREMQRLVVEALDLAGLFTKPEFLAVPPEQVDAAIYLVGYLDGAEVWARLE